MYDFINVIKDYMQHITNLSDKRIMQEAINIAESEAEILDSEITVLNEIFMALKEDYTIKIIQDPVNLDFCLAIVKQEPPIIRNKRDINVLANELKRNSLKKSLTPYETIALNFLDASEHIEDNEILLIQNIIRYINNEWLLQPIEQQKYMGENIRVSRLVPTYSKKLIKVSKGV